jgi:E3 ubiquitin-protein ligase RNF115/126
MGFASILAAALNPANAASGDAVYTQEALDRVISSLMEQNQGSNATAPASEAAIKSLPKKQLVPQDLGDNGKAECNICMDDVTAGDEVTVLPCAHWYHEACVAAWLKESDTCPVCRKGIMPKDGEQQARNSHQDPRNPEPWRGGSLNPWTSITGSLDRAEAAGDHSGNSPEGSGTSTESHRRRSRPHSGSSHGSRSSSYRLGGNTRPVEGHSRRSSRSHGSQNSTGGGLSSRVRNMFNGGGSGV